jgi:hypothetical protein
LSPAAAKGKLPEGEKRDLVLTFKKAAEAKTQKKTETKQE